MQHAFSYILKETCEIVDSSSTACERYSVIHLLTGLANPWANWYSLLGKVLIE